MFRTVSESLGVIGPTLGTVLVLAGAPAALAAQEPATDVAVRSSEIALSRDEAVLQLGLTGDRALSFALRGGRVYLDGADLGAAPRGGALDDAWRELLDVAMETPNADMARLLTSWDAPAADGVGSRLDRALEAALNGEQLAEVLAELDAAGAEAASAAGQSSDSVARLLDRINELETVVDQLEDERVRTVVRSESGGSRGFRPLRDVQEGVEGIMGLLVTMAILVGIGFAIIFFGGRKYIEGVADTARRMTLRSLLVGIAGSFLVLPVFILGIIALVISIVGIPGLLVWVPGFPLAVGLSIILGYVSVAHAAGEAMAEYRFNGSEWFQRANSYYFVASGVGILMALFFGAMVAHMVGWLLGFIEGLLIFFGVALTWAALSVGLGAVLISRGGTRPLGQDPVAEDLFGDDASV